MNTTHWPFKPEDNMFMYAPTNNRFLLGALKREKRKHGLEVEVNLFTPLGRAKPNLAFRLEGNPLKGYTLILGEKPIDYLRIIQETVAKIKTKMESGGVYGESLISEEDYY